MLPCFFYGKQENSFIPLVINMFRKKDGGIGVGARKTFRNRNAFLTTTIRRPLKIQWTAVRRKQIEHAFRMGTDIPDGFYKFYTEVYQHC